MKSWFHEIWAHENGTFQTQNITEDELWEESFTIGFFPPKHFLRCATLKWKKSWEFGTSSFVR